MSGRSKYLHVLRPKRWVLYSVSEKVCRIRLAFLGHPLPSVWRGSIIWITSSVNTVTGTVSKAIVIHVLGQVPAQVRPGPDCHFITLGQTTNKFDSPKESLITTISRPRSPYCHDCSKMAFKLKVLLSRWPPNIGMLYKTQSGTSTYYAR